MITVLCFGVSLTIGGVSKVVLDYYMNFNHNNVVFDFEILTGFDIVYKDIVIKSGSEIYENCKVRDGIFINLKNKYRHIKKKKYNTVYSHTGYKAVPELFFAKLLGIKKRVVHSHTANEHENLLKTIMRKVLSLLVCFLATDLFACSYEAGIWAYGKKACSSSKFRVINNAIDLSLFKNDSVRRKEVRLALGIDNKLVIGCIGRFTYSKNYSFLIDIFNEVHKKNNNSVLVLIGDGNLLPDIKDKVSKLNLTEVVKFLGGRLDVDKLIHSMDIFVMPSHYEGLGLVYLEAQAVGIPCYGSKEGVPKAVNVSDLMNYISLDQTPEEWANIILNNCDNYAYRLNVHSELREAGYDIIIESKKLEKFFTDGAFE